MANPEVQRLADLLRSQRWAAVGTLHDGAPSVSMVAYAIEPEFAGFLIFVSRLSEHTRGLLADPRASLAVTQPDTGDGDPQTLARASIEVEAVEIPRAGAEFEAAAARYVERLPSAQMLFGLGDFVLFRLVPGKIRWVGGFARARNVTVAELRATD